MADKEVPKAPGKGGKPSSEKKIKVVPGSHLPEGKAPDAKAEQGHSPRTGKGVEAKKDLTYEENRISTDDFADLEKKEGKKIRLDSKKKDSPATPRGDARATDVDLLLLKTEKLGGKIEAMEEGSKAIEERLSGLNQEIGELRSSIMEKDRMMREFQQGFTRIKDMAEGMEPEKIRTQFAKKDEAIEKNLAAVESLDARIKQATEDIKSNKSVLESLRDVKGLVGLIGNLKKKVDKVEDDRKFTSRTAGKIESMFSDLATKLAEFQSYKDKIAFNEETMHEIMKTMDSMETNLGEVGKKNDIKKTQGTVDERFEKVDTKIDDKMHDIKGLIDQLLTNLNEAGIKGVLDTIGKSRLEQMFATKEDIEGIKTKLGRLRDNTMDVAREKQEEFQEPGKAPKPGNLTKDVPSAPAKGKGSEEDNIPEAPGREDSPASGPVEGIRNKIDSMIDQAEESVKMGNLDIAKNLYREALSMYNQLNRAETFDEAAQIYERIRRLYSRLRIYS